MISDAAHARARRWVTVSTSNAWLAPLPGMATIVVSPQAVLKLRELLPAITRRHLFDLYGISETTWTKLRDGKPVKLSTLLRIQDRYERLVGQDPPLNATGDGRDPQTAGVLGAEQPPAPRVIIYPARSNE
jgi:DNA-binding Xre family transcriptional regulator